MKERISVRPKIMELQDTNDIYMTMNIAILSEDINFNGAQFTSDFIEGIIEHKDRHVGLPFLVNKEKLENGDFDDLTHELDSKTGELKTDQIGSFVDFWEEEIDGANCLMGSVRIFKRFTETCSAIVSLVKDDSLETSCEVLVKDYLEITEDGIRKIHYNDGNNAFAGSAIVTNGAEKRAKPTLLIAEAYQKDINSEHQGGENLSKEKEYNNGIKVEYFNQELSSLEYYRIEQQIYNKLNPVDVEDGGRDYNYYVHTLYHDKVIVQENDKPYGIYSIGYKIENDTVILDKESDWKKGSFQFVPEGVEVSELMEQKTDKIKELQKEIAELKEENNAMSKEQKKDIEVNENKIEELEKEIAELKETIVSEQEAKLSLEGQVTALNEEIETLKPFKEQVEKAEKEAKVKELKAKYSKLIANEEVFNSERVTKAIEEGDVVELNNVVVEEIAKQKEQEVETAEQEEKDVVITASVQENLITVDKDADYWYDSRD